MRRLLPFAVVALSLALAPSVSAQMAFSELSAGTSSVDGNTTIDSASISPTANRLILALVTAQGSSPGTQTVTGCSLTWDEVLSSSSTAVRITTFRAISASPGSGCVVTANVGTTTGRALQIVEVSNTGAVAADNGAAAIIQSAANSSGAGTGAADITLSAFADATNNGAFLWCNTITSASAPYELDPTATWTQIGSTVTYTSPANSVASAYKVGQDTTVSCKYTGTNAERGIAIEIDYAAEGGGGGRPPCCLLGVF